MKDNVETGRTAGQYLHIILQSDHCVFNLITWLIAVLRLSCQEVCLKAWCNHLLYFRYFVTLLYLQCSIKLCISFCYAACKLDSYLGFLHSFTLHLLLLWSFHGAIVEKLMIPNRTPVQINCQIQVFMRKTGKHSTFLLNIPSSSRTSTLLLNF